MSRKTLIGIFLFCIAYVLVVIYTRHIGYDFITCPSRLILGIPCAGCGGTRAFLLLLEGHPVEAFFMNPNVYLALPFIIGIPLLMGYDVLHHTHRLDAAYQRFKTTTNRPAIYIPLLIFEAAIWGWNIWRYSHGML